MKKFITILLCLSFALAAGTVSLKAASVKEIIAQDHTILSEGEWHGYHRIKFDFEGLTAWVVEPKGATAEGTPWTWTMQWAEAFVPRTGVLDLLEKGWHHVTLEAFAEKASDESLEQMARFQKWLVERLGFNAQARLIGMSWGGFFSIRYANAFPQNVARIYLDAPLLNFDCFNVEDTPWKKTMDTWTDDPRMPVNMAPAIAAAHIPVLLLYGGQDQTVNPDLNCRLFASRLKAAGGEIEVHERGLYGHHPHGMDPGSTSLISDFLAK